MKIIGIEKLYYFVKNSKLRTKLLLGYITIAVFTIGILGLVLYNYSLSVFTKEAENKSYEVMKQINSNIENNLKEMNLMINYLYSRKIGNYAPFIDLLLGSKSDVPSSLLHADWEFDKLFSDIIYFRSDCNGIFVNGDNGIRFSKYLYAATSDYDTKSQWYKDTLNNQGRTTILGTHRQLFSEDGMFVISIAKQIVNPANDIGIGVILLDFDLNTIRKVCKEIDFGTGSNIQICDGSNKIVYSTDESDIMNSVDAGILSQVDNLKSGTTNIEITGEKNLLIFDTIELSGWKIITTIPVKTLMHPWSGMVNIIFFAGLMLIVMIVFISYFISGLISRPILNLTRQVHKIETGDYRIPWTYESKDEIGQLSKGLASMVAKIRELIQNEYKSKLAEKESELKALQAQINPHFIYNTLEMISTMAVIRKVPEIDEVTIALSRMLRYSIKTKGNVVPLSAEIQNIYNYITVYNTRFDYSIKINNTIEPRFLDYGILKLTLQPLIENAIVHGIENSMRDGEITLSAEEKAGVLFIYVIDNGSGISPERVIEMEAIFKRDMENMLWEMDKSESIGLRNVNARLFLYYGDDYGITIDSKKEEGTCIIIKIPVTTVGE